MAPPVLNDLVFKRDSCYHFRYTNLLEIPQVKSSKYGSNSFRHAAPVLWNSFPESFRKASNFNQFKSLIVHWNGKECKCSACNVTQARIAGTQIWSGMPHCFLCFVLRLLVLSLFLLLYFIFAFVLYVAVIYQFACACSQLCCSQLCCFSLCYQFYCEKAADQFTPNLI